MLESADDREFPDGELPDDDPDVVAGLDRASHAPVFQTNDQGLRMAELQGLVPEKEAFHAVGTLLFAMLADGDERVEYRISMTVLVSTTKVRVFNPAGRLEAPEGRYGTPGSPEELHDAVEALRAACYRPGAGTWFSLQIVVQASGVATVEYNYDKEADFGLGGIDPISYVTDQKEFPTDEDKQPEWLKLRLAEGRAGMAARSEWLARSTVINGDWVRKEFWNE